MLTGTNLVYTKKFNLRVVHEVIRVFGPLSRADIARHTELTGQTVSNLVRELLDLRLVREAARRSEGRGAPSTTLALNPDGAFAVGLDFDRDHLTGVLVDLEGTVRHRIHTDLDAPSPSEALELMSDTAMTLIKRQGLRRDQVAGLGVGIPGPMHQVGSGRGYVVNPKALPGWHNIPLADWLRDRLDMPVFLENNATAAAVGEHWYGAGQQISTFFYIYFGSGLGGGLVMDGRPYEGFTGNAGEIGYLPTVLAGDGAASSANDPGHVGLHFNMPRLYEQLREDGTDARTLEDLDALLAAEHPPLLRWMDNASDHLTGLVLAVEYLLDPEAICFGGRLSDRILGGLMERVARQLPLRRIGGKITAPHHLLATAGVDAAALGVATLPMYEIFAPAHDVLLKQRRDPETASAAMPKAVGR
ncbi:MAG: ROK family transcriptional regulator [bacterium]